VNVESHKDGYYHFEEISGSNLKEVFIDYSGSNTVPGHEVWFDSYGREDYRHTEADYAPTVHGWIPADEAEQIGMALVIAARLARGETLES
jgi:hypothetical protein